MTARKTTKTAKPKQRRLSRLTLTERMTGLEDRIADIEEWVFGYSASDWRKKMSDPVLGSVLQKENLSSRLDTLEKWRQEIVTPSFQQVEDYVNALSRDLNKVGDAVGAHYRIVGEWRPATPKEVAEMEGEGWWRRFISTLRFWWRT